MLHFSMVLQISILTTLHLPQWGKLPLLVQEIDGGMGPHFYLIFLTKQCFGYAQ
jgi:hypothetical protein